MTAQLGLHIVCLLTCMTFGTAKTNASPLETSLDFHLLLAGGALEICSSYSPKHCVSKPPTGKSQNHYKLSQNALDRIKDSAMSSNLIGVIEKLNHYISPEILNKNALNALFETAQVREKIRALSDHDYYLIYDALEIKRSHRQPQIRLRETAAPKESKSTSTQAIIDAFIEQAKRFAEQEKAKPQILVVTASSRDSYAAVDYYRSVFAVDGVPGTWLPIDQAWQAANRSQQCDALADFQARYQVFNRQNIYPDLYAEQQAACRTPQKLVDLIQGAHGIFFNGGDQSLTRAALFTPEGKPNDVLRAIQERHAQGKLIVGGTSAGTVVQTGLSSADSMIPMITNGVSHQAIKRGVFAQDAPSQRCVEHCYKSTSFSYADDVTYHSNGGTGLFALGNTDTHFSERNREGRFIALNALTGSKVGIGVDENTAMLISWDMPNKPTRAFTQVIGKHGVFIYDDTLLQVKQTVQGYQLGGRAHYLPSGSSAEYDLIAQNWTFFNQTPAKFKYEIANYPHHTGMWRHLSQTLCKLEKKQPQNWLLYGIKYVIVPLPETQFWVNKHGLCGYTNLGYSIAPIAMD
ncbi:MAG: hypothetical protein GJ671_00480 [Alteromonadaceae bacterium]|nr:hypothetical protein [Alteromonadaceae bacterium]